MLIYSIEPKDKSLIVKIQEQGSKRLLYLDTLRQLAKNADREGLNLLIRLQLRTPNAKPDTMTFNQIVVSPTYVEEVIQFLIKTDRLFFEGKKVEPGFSLWKAKQKKPLEVFPELHLNDATGCFANLWMNYGEEGNIAFDDFDPMINGRSRLKGEEKQAEKDLVESGFIRKQVGNTSYFCATDKVKQTLLFLIELGWRVIDFRGRRVVKQTGVKMEVREEEEGIVIRGHVEFGEEKGSLLAAMKGRLWVELNETTIGLLDRVEKVEGEWEGETLRVKKQQLGTLVAILDAPNVEWEESVRKAAEGLKAGATMELAEPGPSFRGELLPYQQKGVDWLAFLYRWGFSGLLADEMGLGKTVQVLAFFSRLRTNLPILIVAPTSLLYNWQSEIRKFLGIEVYVHSGPDRRSELNGEAWVLTSYAILRLDEELFAKTKFEAIVLDESNAIKTATTQTAKAAYRLKGNFRIAMSGTPIENRIDELLAQFKFLLPDLLDKGLEIELLKRKVRPFLLRRRKEEVQLDLPDKIEQIVWVEMDSAQAEAYQEYKMGLKSGLLKKIQTEGLEPNRMEVLEAILRLRQICCDPRLVGHEAKGAKMMQLLQDVEEAAAEKRKVLIYSQFTQQLQLIRQELKQEPLYLDGSTPASMRGEIVKAFQEDPEQTVFLLSLKAGGVGLNLTAADTVILFDPWWNDAVEQQAIDRAHRIGQKKTVVAKRYLMPHTIEEKLLQLKAQKQSASAQVLDLGENAGWSEADLIHLIL